jgi:hypothetical protein
MTKMPSERAPMPLESLNLVLEYLDTFLQQNWIKRALNPQEKED